MKIEKTKRGFELIRFKDEYRAECSLQQSSIIIFNYEQPGAGAVWFGKGDERMHIDLELMKGLLPHLKKWVKKGSF